MLRCLKRQDFTLLPAVHTEYNATEELVFPDQFTVRILLTGRQTGDAVEVFEDIVPPSMGPPRHIHLNQDETFFFLDGNFEVEVGGKRMRMAAGDVAFIPRGTVHAFKNTGETPGRLRYLFSPAIRMADMFREFHRVMTSGGALGGEVMKEIAGRHGQIFTGAPL